MKVSNNQDSLASWIQWMVNGTDTSKMIGVAAIGLASAAMYVYANTPEAAACLTSNQTALAIWPKRIQDAIDTEGKKWKAFNTAAIAAYRKPELSLDALSDLFAKDRAAYVSFCRTKGVLDPVDAAWRREGNAADQAWFDCVAGEGRKNLQEKCYGAFDSLRKSGNGEYASRLYQSEDYLGAAASWLSHAVWKQSAEQALKSIPQQILDAGIDGTDPSSVIDALSYVKPFEKDQYCATGCAYVKKRYRETMLEVHPDKKPFPDAASSKEAEGLATAVSVAVNTAKETLCSRNVRKYLCN